LSKLIEYDEDAWRAYPQHRWVFNKLDLALKLGYSAGPCGVTVREPGHYIVRPIYNLSGMGVGARRVYLEEGDWETVKPGEFWVEQFHGRQLSIDYAWDHNFPYTPRAIFAAQGYRTQPELYRFNAWRRVQPPHMQLPEWIKLFHDVPQFNIEFVGDHIIEIHLRPGVADFPEGSTEIIPVWEDSAEEQHQFMKSRSEWKWQPSPEDADGHLHIAREGFYFR